MKKIESNKFDYGYEYLSKRLHKAKFKVRKSEPVIVLIPRNIKSYNRPFPTIIASGVNSKGQLVNILRANLDSYTYFLGNERELHLMNNETGAWFIPYIIAVPLDKNTFSDQYLLNKVKDKKQVVVSKEFIQEKTKDLPFDYNFRYGVYINSSVFAYFTNIRLGSNSTSHYTFGLKRAVKRNNHIKKNSYFEMYYPKLYDYLDSEKYLSKINKQDLDRLHTLLRSQDAYSESPSNSLENQIHTKYQQENSRYRGVKVKEVSEIDWEAVLRKSIPSDIFDEIEDGLRRNLIAFEDIVTIYDHALGKDLTKVIIQKVFEHLKDYTHLNTTYSQTAIEIATSEKGISLLEVALTSLKQSIEKKNKR